MWRTTGCLIVADLFAIFWAFSLKQGVVVCASYAVASFTKVEGQGVTVSTKESVPTVSGAFTGAKANPSDTAAQASSQRWVPPHILRETENSNDTIFRRVRAILNKLTPEKFEKLSDELLHVGIETKFILKGIILLVYEKALDEPKYSSLYAKLCLRFSELAPNFDDPGKAGHSTFRRLLLKQCEEEFNSRSKTSTALDRKDGVLTAEEEEQRASNKRKMLGNIKFIGELGKLGMLHEAILHKCIKQLLDKKKRATVADISEDMECLCHLMKTVGSQLDVVKARPLFDQYFDRIHHILENTELPSRIRFMLQDILELRRNKWVPRRTEQDNAAPRPIHEIRQEAWQSRKGGMLPGDPMFPYGPRYNKRGKMTTGRGFEDVFMSDSSFDSFLPMEDFRDMRINDGPFGAGHPFPTRFDEMPPVRAMRNEDPYFSNMKGRSSPPDFMPNFQSAPKKPQMNEARPRRVQTQKGRTPDGQISLRPVRDSIVAQPTSRTGQTSSLSNQPRQTNGQMPVTNEKPKQTKKAYSAPKVDTEKLVVSIIEEFLKSKSLPETINCCKDLNSPQAKESLIVKLLQSTLQQNAEDQNLVADLVKKCFDEKILTSENISKGMKSYIRNLSNAENSDVVKASLGKFSSRLVIENLLDVNTTSKVMEPVDLLFLQCLKDLKKLKGEDWLLELLSSSKVNLVKTLPEQYRNAEKMTEILREQGLIFLSPQLKAQTELFKQIQSDSNVSTLYKWIKDNIDVKLHSSPEFASVLTTCVLKYVTMTTSLAPDIDRNQPLEKEVQDQEKSMMENMKPLLQKFLNDNVQLQVRALYALQEFCHSNDFPKGLLLRMFVMLYDLEIIEEDAFISWKEDVNDQHPGKGKALFQVNAWLTWLETAAEESSESEPE